MFQKKQKSLNFLKLLGMCILILINQNSYLIIGEDRQILQLTAPPPLMLCITNDAHTLENQPSFHKE